MGVSIPVIHRREGVVRDVVDVPLCHGRSLVVLRHGCLGVAHRLVRGVVRLRLGVVVCEQG